MYDHYFFCYLITYVSKSLLVKRLFFFSFIFISWRLITLQYCNGFCHTLTWISHGVTCIPHPNPPSHLPLYPIPLGLPSAPGPSTCLMHPIKGLLVSHFLLNFYCLRGTKLQCQWFSVHYINRYTQLMNASQIENNIFGIKEREFTVYPGKVDILSIN